MCDATTRAPVRSPISIVSRTASSKGAGQDHRRSAHTRADPSLRCARARCRRRRTAAAHEQFHHSDVTLHLRLVSSPADNRPLLGEALPHERAHPGDLVRRGRTASVAAHHLRPHRAVSNHQHRIRPDAVFLDLRPLRGDRPRRASVVIDNDCGDALGDEVRCGADLGVLVAEAAPCSGAVVRVRVDVDEARRNELPVRIDGALGGRVAETANGSDATVADANVRRDCRIAGPSNTRAFLISRSKRARAAAAPAPPSRSPGAWSERWRRAASASSAKSIAAGPPAPLAPAVRRVSCCAVEHTAETAEDRAFRPWRRAREPGTRRHDSVGEPAERQRLQPHAPGPAQRGEEQPFAAEDRRLDLADVLDVVVDGWLERDDTAGIARITSPGCNVRS